MVRGGPDGRKYEKETADITRRIKELESKLVSFGFSVGVWGVWGRGRGV